jgi:hypothetical protein
MDNHLGYARCLTHAPVHELQYRAAVQQYNHRGHPTKHCQAPPPLMLVHSRYM